jgi:two-component system cell cycle sensor histidine kinase/response regulator CckA
VSREFAHSLRSLLPPAASALDAVHKALPVRCQSIKAELDNARSWIDEACDIISKRVIPAIPDTLTGEPRPVGEVVETLINHVDRRFKKALAAQWNGPCKTVLIRADAPYLERAFAELAQNAITVNSGTVGLWITVEQVHGSGRSGVEGSSPSTWLQIQFCDDGKGVADSDKHRIFQPDVTLADGTGCGLALVRRIIEAHGCSIHECGTVGRGAVFSILFPISDGGT